MTLPPFPFCQPSCRPFRRNLQDRVPIVSQPLERAHNRHWLDGPSRGTCKSGPSVRLICSIPLSLRHIPPHKHTATRTRTRNRRYTYTHMLAANLIIRASDRKNLALPKPSNTLRSGLLHNCRPAPGRSLGRNRTDY